MRHILGSKGFGVRVLSAIATTVLLLCMAASGPEAQASEPGTSWPMFHHDLGHTGHSVSEAPDTSDVRWTYTTGAEVVSSPAVADGKLYVGSYDEQVYCLRAETGEELWSYSGVGVVRSSPAVADGRVYVGSANGRLRCLDAETGGYFWGYPTGGPVRSSPTVADDRVYVGSDDGYVYCLDAETGADIWTYPTGAEVVSSPAVARGMVYVGSLDGSIYCLNAANGDELWAYPTGGPIYSSPSVVDGKVYVGSADHSVYCLDAKTGDEVWSFATAGWVESSPAIAYGRVYVGSDDYDLYCLDAETGDYIWSYPTGGPVHSSPAVADGKVYVGSTDGYVYCLNAQTGDEIWYYSTGGSVDCSPAIADGRVYVGSDDGSIYAFAPDIWPVFQHDTAHLGYSVSEAPDTDAVLWTSTVGYLIGSSPAVAEGRLYVGSGDNSLYCLNADDGDFIWSYETGDGVRSSPAVAYGKAYVTSDDGSIYCLEAETGDPIWTRPTSWQVPSSPCVANGKVYVVAGNDTLFCLDAETGDSLWSYELTIGTSASPTVADGKVYVGSYHFCCLDAETGGFIWRYTVAEIVYSAAAVGDGKVYLGAMDNNVYCLDAENGDLIWSYPTGGEVYSSPALAGGKVYVGSDDSTVYCLDADTGDSVWAYRTRNEVLSSPAVADGKVYVGSDDSTLYCLDADTGDLIWGAYTEDGAVHSSPAVAYGRVYVGSRSVSGNTVYAFGQPPPEYTLMVAASAGGMTDPAPGPHICLEDSLIEVMAIPDPDYLLHHWELDGLNIGSANPVSVLMDMDYVLEAVFVPAYTLAITATAGGTTDPSPGPHLCFQGSTVEVTALEEACYVFDHWELDGGNGGTANPRSVFMDDDHSLHAVFLEIADIWPMLQRDQWRGGHTTSEAPRTNYNMWTYTTGANVVSSAAFVDGKIYVGSADGDLYCLNSSTGAYEWSYPAGHPIGSSPAVAYGKVYFLAGYDLHCVDQSNGDYIWSYETGTAGESSPAAAYGNIYVGSYHGDVYCLDAETGVLTWKYQTDDYILYGSPAVGYRRVYIGTNSGTLYCLDSQTGELAWSYPTGDEIRGAPAIADSMVYVGSFDGSVYCLNALTGDYVWDYPTGGFVWSSPAVVDTLVYAGSSTGRVHCLHASSGEPIWSYLTGDPVFSSPGIAQGRVYVGSYDSTVYCLHASTGDLIWTYETGDRVHASPAVADSMVFVGSYDNNVYAFGPIHDVAVTGVVPGDTLVCLGDTLSIDVTVENQGEFDETFGVAAPYFGGTAIPTSVQWKTFWGMGDVNRDGFTDSTDYHLIEDAFASEPGDPNWNPDADLNEDLVVDMADFNILAYNFGQNIWTFSALPLPEPGTQRGLKLFVDADTTVTFRWYSGGVSPGDSTLSAHATPVPDEVDSTDNTYIDSIVTVVPDSVTLTVSASPGGTTDPVPGPHMYACGCSVQVTALPDSAYYFDHWELDGDDTGSVNPCSLSMRGDHALHAVFYLSYCEIRPASIDFDSLGLGLARDTTFTIANTGVDTLTGDITEDCDNFSIISGGGGFILAPGESLAVTVEFLPDSVKEYTCTIELGSFVCKDVSCAGAGKDVSGLQYLGDEPMPSVFSLMQNRPNPFGLVTEIRYGLPAACRVRLGIYDVLGRKVATLADEYQLPGYKAVYWDTRNDEGRRAPEGVYFYRLEAGRFRETKKMVFLK